MYVSVGGKGTLAVVQVGAVHVDHTPGVEHDDVFLPGAQGHIEPGA